MPMSPGTLRGQRSTTSGSAATDVQHSPKTASSRTVATIRLMIGSLIQLARFLAGSPFSWEQRYPTLSPGDGGAKDSSDLEALGPTLQPWAPSTRLVLEDRPEL